MLSTMRGRYVERKSRSTKGWLPISRDGGCLNVDVALLAMHAKRRDSREHSKNGKREAFGEACSPVHHAEVSTT